MDLYIGKMLDNRYEILERIGTGGMAVVYKAKCHRLNRLVAVKILKEDLAQDEDFRRRFNAESQAVAQLSHPNIVSVYDVSRGGDTEYIVMELIDGITLKQYMEKRGQLNWRESLHFATQIMRGLSHAHSRGIVHRDIKPQNIMVLRDGSVKVADFGIACLENSSQTLTQDALGSVHYISPEQARGDRIDARSDLYSAGVVLYEMLTGRLPFEGDSAVSVALQHLSAIPLAPREIHSEIPEQLELICLKAMAADIDRRYPSANAMIADLEAFRKNPDVDLDFEMADIREEEPDEPTQPLRQSAVIKAAAKPAPPREREKRYEEERPGSSKNKVLAIIALVLALALVAVLVRSMVGSFTQPVTEQFMVPKLLDMTVENARRQPEVEGIFTIEEMEPIFTEDYDEGHIAKQDPSPGEYRKGDNTVIRVWVSAGEEKGEMPDLTNRTVQEARVLMKNMISRYNLILEEPLEQDWVYNDEIASGRIISTVPTAHETLKKGDTITVLVSKGPEIREYPMLQFVGQQLESVLPQLGSLGLVCDPSIDVSMVDSDKEAGLIIWQSIPVNQMYQEGESIKFQVSAGQTAVTLLQFFDLPESEEETVHVQVYVGSEPDPQYDEMVPSTAGNVRVILQGSGVQDIRVFFDGVQDVAQGRQIIFQ